MSEQSTAQQFSGQPADSGEFRQCSVADLDGDHRDLLTRAITRILATEIAEITYAQIIDGLPTSEVAYDSRDEPPPDHPIERVTRHSAQGYWLRRGSFVMGFDLKF
jgi:hypothetical protein